MIGHGEPSCPALVLRPGAREELERCLDCDHGVGLA